MSNIKAIAMIHNGRDVEVVEVIITTEMTSEEYVAHINRMRREMKRMQMEYDSLLSIAETLERQRDRLLREKFASIKEELQYSYSHGLLNRLLGK